MGSVPSLSGHAIAYRLHSLSRVHRYRASKPQGSSERVLPWQVAMGQLICASLSYAHYWCEVGMLKVTAVMSLHDWPKNVEPLLLVDHLYPTYLYGHPPWFFTQVTNHQVGNIPAPRSYLKMQKRCMVKTGPADQKPKRPKQKNRRYHKDSNGHASKARRSSNQVSATRVTHPKPPCHQRIALRYIRHCRR